MSLDENNSIYINKDCVSVLFKYARSQVIDFFNVHNEYGVKVSLDDDDKFKFNQIGINN